MAEDDALAYLKDRIKSTVPDQPSRASRVPIDSAPETHMGASTAALASTEGEASVTKPVIVGEVAKRRTRKMARREPSAAMDPDLMNKILSGLKEGTTVNRTSTSSNRDTEEKAKEAENKVEPSPSPASATLSLPKPTAPPVLPIAQQSSPKPHSPLKAAEIPATTTAATTLSKANEEEYKALQDELAITKSTLKKVTEKLEKYDVLCENLLETETGDPKDLAKCISSMMDRIEEAEQAQSIIKEKDDAMEKAQGELEQARRQMDLERQEIIQLREDLAATQHELEQQKAQSVSMSPESRGEGIAGIMTENQSNELDELKSALQAKEDEITLLQNQLKQVQTTVTVGNEGMATMEQAERDLKAMEELIREQEEYMMGLEQEMEKALEGLPEGIRAEFLKEKERIMQEASANMPPSLQAFEESTKADSITK